MPVSAVSAAPALRQHAPRLLAWLAVLLSALACLWLLVQLAWSLLTPVDVTRVAPSTAPAGGATAVTAVTQVSRWHLFGNGQQNQLAIDIASAGNRTSLKLVLHGTVAEHDGEDGYAIIADAKGSARSYHVGDAIEDGVTLAAVYADRVVLDNHGRHETLSLPRTTLTPAAAPAADSPTGGAPSANPPKPIFIAPNVATGSVGWQQARADLRDNPAKALQQFDIQPVLDGTRLRGVRLGGGAANPLAAAAGLGADDVVTAVNGIPLDSLSRGQELMGKLQGARHVRLTVERGGQTRTVEVDVPQQ
ncbi:MAG TPA: type II secretion system protein N [Rhodanobacteraceae bacterium]|nr:type II secretion system protein N [Rhodanobacteraceae bacterium]